MCCRQTRGVARPNFLSVSYDNYVYLNWSQVHTQITVKVYEVIVRYRHLDGIPSGINSNVEKETWSFIQDRPLAVELSPLFNFATDSSHNFDKRAQQHCYQTPGIPTSLEPNDNTIHNDELLPIDTILSTISIHEPTSRRFANNIQI